ncbi:hypothetical protein E1A91_D11G204500v1 [Gossypium mustelinum]|uniref:RING-type E3 ubiquitin transferase n=1 Tax=Gossypium mustelinum TaxID=34275 RepID=A0A5D2STV8_GOSMU|nr:hypothetical protein E1A91_D11G204500v1 [Gossypium mustelinum]
MPTIHIEKVQVCSETHYAVCKEPFELKWKAREMPCNHIYHEDCITPWLALWIMCPPCRHELPLDGSESNGDASEIVGLSIWRLSGGIFAMGFNFFLSNFKNINKITFIQFFMSFLLKFVNKKSSAN